MRALGRFAPLPAHVARQSRLPVALLALRRRTQPSGERG